MPHGIDYSWVDKNAYNIANGPGSKAIKKCECGLDKAIEIGS